MIAWVVLAGCAGDGTDTTPQPNCEDGDTWTTVGEPFVRTWCTSCHASTLPAELRYGAPLGLDFDTLAGVRASADAVAGASTGDAPRMPPALSLIH
ncbi:MAG: hypothetical protein ABMB14_23675, partial [Myxococcota bacterium]